MKNKESIWLQVFKPSTLITGVIVIIFIIMAIVASTAPNANDSFFDICADAIKILCGGLAGAIAGEKYAEKEKK